jgi:hypothetical protein
MKRLLKAQTYFNVAKVLLSTVLVAVLFFSNLSALAAQSSPTEGTAQLDEIFQKTEEALDSPAMSLEKIEERSKNGLNEVQGDANRDKMIRSENSEIPAAKAVEKSLSKNKKNRDS